MFPLHRQIFTWQMCWLQHLHIATSNCLHLHGLDIHILPYIWIICHPETYWKYPKIIYHFISSRSMGVFPTKVQFSNFKRKQFSDWVLPGRRKNSIRDQKKVTLFMFFQRPYLLLWCGHFDLTFPLVPGFDSGSIEAGNELSGKKYLSKL